MDNLKIIKSERKTIALQVLPNGKLVVRAPVFCSDKIIHDFVISKESWVLKKQKQIKERAVFPSSEIKPGGKAPFLGEFYNIKIDTGLKELVVFDNAFIFKSEEIINFALKNWYRMEAYNIIPGITEVEASKFSFNDIAEVKINSAKRRWGSCTSRKNINFSWRLIALPEEVIRYVVIHELAHLVELNHSKKFWNVVENLLPEYKLYEKWLKKNSFKFALNI